MMAKGRGPKTAKRLARARCRRLVVHRWVLQKGGGPTGPGQGGNRPPGAWPQLAQGSASKGAVRSGLARRGRCQAHAECLWCGRESVRQSDTVARGGRGGYSRG